MASPILVTGGAGFIGSNLVRRLLQLGNSVRVFDDLSRGRYSRLFEFVGDDRLEVIQGDIRDPLAVGEAARGCEVIWHLAYVGAPQNFLDNPKLMWEIGVKGMVNLLEACAQQGGKELFLVSTSEVYAPDAQVPTPETVPLWVADVSARRASYGGGKIASELGALAYSYSGFLARTVIVRPHSVYGPDAGSDHVIPQFCLRLQELDAKHALLTDSGGYLTVDPLPFPIQGSGQETRSFIFISDLIEAFMVLMAKGRDRQVYHLGSEESVSMAELAHLVAQAYGLEIEVVPGQVSAGQPPRRRPEIAKLKALGWEPKVGLAEGLKVTAAWYRLHG
jgi:nucleoside-diphosphate-sugar epimerase